MAVVKNFAEPEVKTSLMKRTEAVSNTELLSQKVVFFKYYVFIYLAA